MYTYTRCTQTLFLRKFCVTLTRLFGDPTSSVHNPSCVELEMSTVVSAFALTYKRTFPKIGSEWDRISYSPRVIPEYRNNLSEMRVLGIHV